MCFCDSPDTVPSSKISLGHVGFCPPKVIERVKETKDTLIKNYAPFLFLPRNYLCILAMGLIKSLNYHSHLGLLLATFCILKAPGSGRGDEKEMKWAWFPHWHFRALTVWHGFPLFILIRIYGTVPLRGLLTFFPFLFFFALYFLFEPSPTRFNFRYHSRSTFLAERGWKSFSFSNANACSHLTLLTHLSRFEGNIMMLSVRGRERERELISPENFVPFREPISWIQLWSGD